MMRRLFLSMILALGGVATARAVEQDLYNPLAVGLRWDVDVEVTRPGSPDVHGTAVREITGVEKINAYTYFIVTTTFTGVPNIKDFTMYRRKSAHGIHAIMALDKDKQEHLEAVLPLTVGQSWKTLISGRVITSTVEGKEAVKIGDKTYENCMKISYKMEGGILAGTSYQAPDVGNVQEETQAGGSIFKFTLKKFSGLK